MSAGHPVTLEEFSAGYGDRYRNSDERVLPASPAQGNQS
jgi:hypothetical protein